MKYFNFFFEIFQGKKNLKKNKKTKKNISVIFDSLQFHYK